MSTVPSNDGTDIDQIVRQATIQREAFAALYDRFFPLVHRYCQRRLLDCAAADDLSSEIFLSVAQTIRRFPGTTEVDFRRWLYRIATNAINAYFRKRRRRQALFERAIHQGWWTKSSASEMVVADRSLQEDAHEEQIAKLLQAIAILSPREQTVITLRFWEGMSYEEVGHVIEVRPATVRVVASRAIQKLRGKLVGWQTIDVLPHEGRKT
ncbi:MAG TPA: sigma-70 family RNA polymerase sigma factor [Pirellulales bacterium]|jgi:RNA polymerase sigma-70 factor (ECF subfamily)